MKVLILVFASFFSAASFAQKDLSEKIKEIEGTLDKITISTSEGEFTFEGKDAEELLGRIKSNERMRVFSLHDFDDEDVVWLEDEKFDHGFKFHVHPGEDGESDTEIIVTDEDGEKKVVVKTEENGEKKIDIYEGQEAEEFLKEREKEGTIKIDINSDSAGEKKIIIKKERPQEKEGED